VAEHKQNPSAELAIYGVEKTDETGRLCRLNLAVHGLEGDIRDGGSVNSYYDDPHAAAGQFDFVLANPPFNVNGRHRCDETPTGGAKWFRLLGSPFDSKRRKVSQSNCRSLTRWEFPAEAE
jgi:type I restriction-modification system DNA methylase subunit